MISTIFIDNITNRLILKIDQGLYIVDVSGRIAGMSKNKPFLGSHLVVVNFLTENIIIMIDLESNVWEFSNGEYYFLNTINSIIVPKSL